MAGPRTTPTDVEIGRLLRAQRVQAGYTLENLADCLCITYQQLSKYERGYNRLSASRLQEIAGILSIPPSALLPDAATVVPCDNAREMRDLARAYQQIASPEHRAAVRHLARSLAETEVVKLSEKGAA